MKARKHILTGSLHYILVYSIYKMYSQKINPNKLDKALLWVSPASSIATSKRRRMSSKKNASDRDATRSELFAVQFLDKGHSALSWVFESSYHHEVPARLVHGLLGTITKPPRGHQIWRRPRSGSHTHYTIQLEAKMLTPFRNELLEKTHLWFTSSI